MTDGTGFHQAWGLSPALNILKIFDSNANSSSKKSGEAISVLLMKPGDIRHVCKTLSSRHCFSNRPLHFYIYEDPTELVARHLLLLSIFCDWGVPIRQRAHTFLEVFGNSKVQERTAQYIQEQGEKLIELICDGEGPLADTIDVSLLKYKVRDGLEMVYKSYNTKVPFNVDSLHEHRLRGLFKERYDARSNLIDMQYHKGIKDFCSIVHRIHYRKWRLSGIAFEFGDQTYTQPNRSLSSYAEAKHKDGSSKLVRGFWVDVVNSPYISFGIDCEKTNDHAKELFKIVNKDTGAEQHRHNSVEVSVYNMLSFLYELETAEKYEMTQANQIYSGLGGADDPAHVRYCNKTLKANVKNCDDGNENENTPPPEPPSKKKEDEALSEEKALQRAKRIIRTMHGIKLFLLSNSGGVGDKNNRVKAEDCDLWKKKRYKNLFDVVVLGNGAADNLPYLKSSLSPKGAVVMVETAKHVVPLDIAQKQGYLKGVHDLALKIGLKLKTEHAGGAGGEIPLNTEHLTYVL
eukprot:g6290.t1